MPFFRLNPLTRVGRSALSLIPLDLNHMQIKRPPLSGLRLRVMYQKFTDILEDFRVSVYGLNVETGSSSLVGKLLEFCVELRARK